MKLQKIAAGARAFSLPPFSEKVLGTRLDRYSAVKSVTKNISSFSG